MHKLRCHIRKYRNYSNSATSQEWNHLSILSRIEFKLTLCLFHQPQRIGNISDCIFHSHNIFHISGQSSRRLWSNLTSCSSWNIIQNNWDIYILCNLCIMANQPFLCCFIIIGCHHQKPICTCLLCLAR